MNLLSENRLADIMLNDLLIWGALLVGLVFLVVDKRRGYGALTLAYFLALSIGHVPGALAYLDETIISDFAEPTEIGFNVTLIGMTAFIAGAMAARVLPWRTTSAQAYQQTVSLQILSRNGLRTLAMGIASYFVALPFSALLPSFTAVASAMGGLLIIGLWVWLYAATIAKNNSRIWLILAMLPMLPLATLVTGGFIGYGTVWGLSIVAFLYVITRRRIWFHLAAPLVIFLGLSLFVTYAKQREEIRDVIWYQNAGMTRRVEEVSKLVTDFQLLDLSNAQHLDSLDKRLNQNYLVGVGVMRHREGQELWYGTTVPPWALIPRVIWPDKPSVGGGQDLVSLFTGIMFAGDTSVGVGQVLEFYMNFAMPGVVAGFALFGFILMRLDQGVMRALAMRNIQGAVKFALPGLALVQPLGNLLEILVAVIAAIIASRILVHSRLMGLPPEQSPSAKMPAQKMRGVVGR
jgi:hypothetical protein